MPAAGSIYEQEKTQDDISHRHTFSHFFFNCTFDLGKTPLNITTVPYKEKRTEVKLFEWIGL
jgi:hypothetical protein